MNLSPRKKLIAVLANPQFQVRALTVAISLLAAAPVFAQAGGDPWTRAVQVLQQSFTTTIARGLALVAIVVGGLGFAYGEGGSKRLLAGIISTQISNLNSTNEPSGVRRHLCLCGFECGEGALEVHTQWVTNQTSPFSSRSMLP